MGMAASQARLLSLTARIHDIEYQAQSIQNAKVQLATQSDQVYKDYLEALDATTLTLKNNKGDTIPASFSNIRGFKADRTSNGDKYALLDSSGMLIVDQNEKDAYEKMKNNTPYEFAMAMCTGGAENYSKTDNDFKFYESFNTGLTEPVKKDMDELKKAIEELDKNPNRTEEDDKTLKKKKELFSELLYKHCGKQIYTSIAGDGINDAEIGEKFNQDEFNYYVNLFKQIQAAGGCISIDDKKFANALDESNSYKNSSEWLKMMIQSGMISVQIVKTEINGDVKLNTTSISSDTNLEYTTTSTIDKTALAKAEAKYENDTRKINQKDKKFDMDLSKLETERSALTKEYDSVKKVTNDNIERTFGIFS